MLTADVQQQKRKKTKKTTNTEWRHVTRRFFHYRPLVHARLDVNADGRCALVQNGELRLMVEETRHGDALLLATVM
jgi:hypothetical protein